MVSSTLFCALSVALAASASAKPRPTVFLHGVNGQPSNFDGFISRMKQHFGASAPPMHSLPLFPGKSSLETPMTKQRDVILKYLVDNAVALNITQGFNFVGHSQGALLARAVIQALPAGLNVSTYLSLAGPQLGQWGMCTMSKGILSKKIVKEMTREVGWVAFYNPIAQRELSVANYWNDPNHQWSFKEFDTFLTETNNLVKHDNSATYKANFLRLERAIFLGSEGDNCINPQLSSVFQFVDGSNQSVPRNASTVYVDDTFGLRSLDERGGLVTGSPPGLKHMSWVNSADVFNRYIVPLLSDW